MNAAAPAPGSATDNTVMDYVQGLMATANWELCKALKKPTMCTKAQQVANASLSVFGQNLNWAPMYDVVYLQWMLEYYKESGDARFYKCPSTVKAGDLVLIGALPGVAVDDYSSKSLGTTFRIAGTFTFTVIGGTTVSPLVGSQVNQGDVIYATGTLDSPTNCTTGLTLSKASGGTSVGTYDDPNPIASGVTSTTAAVKLKESA